MTGYDTNVYTDVFKINYGVCSGVFFEESNISLSIKHPEQCNAFHSDILAIKRRGTIIQQQNTTDNIGIFVLSQAVLLLPKSNMTHMK